MYSVPSLYMRYNHVTEREREQRNKARERESGERWRELERDGEGRRELERVGESWSEMERDGEGRREVAREVSPLLPSSRQSGILLFVMLVL